MMTKTLWNIYVINALRDRPDLAEHGSAYRLKKETENLIPDNLKEAMAQVPPGNPAPESVLRLPSGQAPGPGADPRHGRGPTPVSAGGDRSPELLPGGKTECEPLLTVNCASAGWPRPAHGRAGPAG